MTLDLSQLGSQIEAMTSDLSASLQQRTRRVADAVAILGEQGRDFQRLKVKIDSSRGRTTWLVAGLRDGLASTYQPRHAASDYAVVGVDGSQIGLDRHSIAQCCVINVGVCSLRYGDEPQAELESAPSLYYRDEHLFIDSPSDSTARQALEGPVFAAKREIVAARHLCGVVKRDGSKTPLLALLDASLALWQLSGKNIPDFVRERLLVQEFLPCLDELRRLGAEKRIALASYVSAPRATDVVNALRVGICPHEPTNCNHFCPPRKGKECAQVDGVRDRDIFSLVLSEPGSRSEVFSSLSSIVQDYYRDHEVCFYYLNVGSEIARVEIPRWVADDAELLDLTHSLILDQTVRGQGYPVALTEAHERAVITAADRDSFWLLVENEMENRLISGRISEKSRSKSTRGI